MWLNCNKRKIEKWSVPSRERLIDRQNCRISWILHLFTGIYIIITVFYTQILYETRIFLRVPKFYTRFTFLYEIHIFTRDSRFYTRLKMLYKTLQSFLYQFLIHFDAFLHTSCFSLSPLHSSGYFPNCKYTAEIISFTSERI